VETAEQTPKFQSFLLPYMETY